MQPAPAQPESQTWLEVVADWPVHSARRSFDNFSRHVYGQVRDLPDLTRLSAALLLHAEHTRVEPKAFLHYAATDPATLARELPEAWRSFLPALTASGLAQLEIWAGGLSDARIWESLGFAIHETMATYCLELLEAHPEDPRIRPYEPGDFDAIFRIHRLTSAENWWLSETAYRDWLARVETRVLEIDGAIAGLTHLRLQQPSGLFDGLAVDPTYQRRGLASALVRDALNEAHRRNVQRIDLFVLTDNEAAIRLYEQFGFHRTGEQVRLQADL
jgi:ribosomal protein S18 acetylase RimI-like enzyme